MPAASPSESDRSMMLYSTRPQEGHALISTQITRATCCCPFISDIPTQPTPTQPWNPLQDCSLAYPTYSAYSGSTARHYTIALLADQCLHAGLHIYHGRGLGHQHLGSKRSYVWHSYECLQSLRHALIFQGSASAATTSCLLYYGSLVWLCRIPTSATTTRCRHGECTVCTCVTTPDEGPPHHHPSIAILPPPPIHCHPTTTVLLSPCIHKSRQGAHGAAASEAHRPPVPT
jgi:hypothetical protein